jgi:hypothetical protein
MVCHATEPREPMRHLPLLLLAAMLLIVGLFSAFVGLIWQGTPPPATEVLSVRGEAVKLTGSGIYRYNPAMLGAGSRRRTSCNSSCCPSSPSLPSPSPAAGRPPYDRCRRRGRWRQRARRRVPEPRKEGRRRIPARTPRGAVRPNGATASPDHRPTGNTRRIRGLVQMGPIAATSQGRCHVEERDLES